jgi:hypothetical protein
MLVATLRYSCAHGRIAYIHTDIYDNTRTGTRASRHKSSYSQEWLVSSWQKNYIEYGQPSFAEIRFADLYELDLCLGTDNSNRGDAKHFADLERVDADAARGTMHEHCLGIWSSPKFNGSVPRREGLQMLSRMSKHRLVGQGGGGREARGKRGRRKGEGGVGKVKEACLDKERSSLLETPLLWHLADK